MKGKCYRKEIDESSIICEHRGLSQKAELTYNPKSRKWRFLVSLILLLGVGLLGVSCAKAQESNSTNDLSEEESLEVIKALAKNLKKYDELRRFCEGLAAVIKYEPGPTCGFINMKGEEIIPCTSEIDVEDLVEFHEGLAYMRLDGYINTKGEIVIPSRDDWSHSEWGGPGDFHDGIATIRLDDEDKGYGYCFINTKGEEVIPRIYNASAGDFHEGLAMIEKIDEDCNYYFVFINKKGEEVIPCRYSDAGDFHEGLAKVRNGDWENGKYGFINTKGEEVIPCRYDEAGDFHEGLARVQKGDKYGFVNTKGEEVIPCRYDYVGNFSEGLAYISKGEKIGFINKKGEEVIPCRYDYYDDHENNPGYLCGEIGFNNGLARIRKGDWENGKYGFINTKGEEVIPFIYDYAMNFNDGLALVRRGEEWGYIDKYGHCTIDY